MLATILTILTVVLAVLKLAGILAISWFLVFLPVILGAVMFLVGVIVGFVTIWLLLP